MAFTCHIINWENVGASLMARSAVHTESHTPIYTVHCEASSIGSVLYSRPVIPSHLPNLPPHSCPLSVFIPILTPPPTFSNLKIVLMCWYTLDVYLFIYFFLGNNLHQNIFFELLMLFIFHIRINFSNFSHSNQSKRINQSGHLCGMNVASRTSCRPLQQPEGDK